MAKANKIVLLAQGVDYYPDSGEVHLIRCPECGRENYAVAVASGKCCWCGFDGRSLINIKNEKRK